MPQQELVSPLEAPKGHLVAAALDPSSRGAPLTAPGTSAVRAGSAGGLGADLPWPRTTRI